MTPVITVSIYSKPSELREWVTHYKEGRGQRVMEYGKNLESAIAGFLLAYGPMLKQDYGPFDYGIPVPSAGLAEGAVESLFSPSASILAPLRNSLGFAEGAVVKSGVHDPMWFNVKHDVGGERLILVDDVYTSGARAQSASAALRRCGADVKLILVMARRINPQFTPEAGRLWARQVALDYDFTQPPYWR